MGFLIYEYLESSLLLEGPFSFLRLLNYISVRATFAFLTAFLISLIFGRRIILSLYKKGFRETKREVVDKIIQDKKGTPTMGGLLIVLAILSSSLLWCNLKNLFVLLAIASVIWFGTIGLIDDRKKLIQKSSDVGLSRSKKLLLQGIFGLILGLIIFSEATSPFPRGSSEFYPYTFKEPAGFAVKLRDAGDPLSKYIREQFPAETQQLLEAYNESHPPSDSLQTALVTELNQLLIGESLYKEERFVQAKLTKKVQKLIENNPGGEDLIRLNRLLLEEAYPKEIAKSEDMMHNLYVPFYKYPLINLSWFYVLFCIFIVLSISNAVNFADGLDGLAIVPASTTVAVYGLFAYIAGNIKYSEYLLYNTIPGTGELTVLCSGVVGAGLGFLWYNAYPAHVFMGDTGSQALGGLIATIALLIKQEFLFLIAGGIFLAEAVSVLVQDRVGIARIGRRFLYRAPLHHTFQHRGISEPTVVVRFWIISIILALMSLVTLKIR